MKCLCCSVWCRGFYCKACREANCGINRMGETCRVKRKEEEKKL